MSRGVMEILLAVMDGFLPFGSADKEISQREALLLLESKEAIPQVME